MELIQIHRYRPCLWILSKFVEQNPPYCPYRTQWWYIITICHYHYHNHHHLALSSSQPPPSVTIIINTTTTKCHYHHPNHHHLSLSSSQPPPSVTIISKTTTICHYHQQNHHHLSLSSAKPQPSVTIVSKTSVTTRRQHLAKCSELSCSHSDDYLKGPASVGWQIRRARLLRWFRCHVLLKLRKELKYIAQIPAKEQRHPWRSPYHENSQRQSCQQRIAC